MRTAIVLILVLGAMGIVQAGQITVVNWSGTLDVPDNDEYATSYLVSSAPSGAIVTGVSYQTLVDDRGTPANFWCSDYEIGLSSTARGGTADYLLVWDNAGGQTDSGADDDLANDSDIDLDDSASAFDGQAVNQRWYLVVKDNVSHVGTYKGLGSLKAVTLTIQYVAPPSATTQAATSVTATSATLNGTVSNDGGEACQYHFRYKKEGGSYSYTAYTGSKLTGESFSLALTGLDPGATYYFAAQAKNSAGESTWPGSDTSFTTPPLVPTVSTQPATSVTSTSATLNGRVTNDGGAACQYRFRSKESGTISYTESSWTGSVRTGESFNLPIPSGLSPGTTYVFAAKLKNSAGESAWGSELSFTTPPAKPVATTQAATGITSTGATLNGTVSNDGGEACQYRFRYKKEGGSYAYTAYTGSKLTGESFSLALTGLDPGATYYFAAQAKNSAGESTWPGSDTSFTTPPLVPTVSTQPATSVTSTSATLNGRVTNDGGAACQYRFRSKESGAISYTESSWTGSVTTGQSFSLTIPSGLAPGKTYVFAAKLKNSAGESAWGSELSFTTPPAKPIATTQAATGITSTSATLNGTVSNDGGEACQYHFRYKKEGGSYSYTAYTGSKTTGQSFSEALTGLDPGTTYYFAAQAKNSAGESTWPGSDTSFTTPPIPPTVMTVPATNVTPTSATANGRVVDDGGAACQYRFRAKEFGASSYTYIDWTGSVRTGQSFSFSLSIGLSPGTTYVFAAQLKNSAGEGEWGSNLTITLPVAKPVAGTLAATDVDGNSATLNGRIADDGSEACEYRFRYKKEGGSYTYTPYAGSKETGQSFSHSLTDLDPASTYYFAAQAKNSAGESNWPGTDARFTTLSLPTGFTRPATGVTETTATLNGIVTDDGGATCQYRFRCRETGVLPLPAYTYSDWTGSVRTGQSFSFTLPSGLSPGKTYYFAAQLKNSAGEGAWANDLSLTTTAVKPKVLTQAATDITSGSATLNGIITDTGGTTCQYHFRYKKEGGDYIYTAYTGSMRTAGPFSYPLPGLDAATTYYFAAQVKNTAGQESTWPTSDLSFTTKFMTKPAACTQPATDIATRSLTLAGKQIIQSQATLNGTVTDDGGAPCQYRFHYWWREWDLKDKLKAPIDHNDCTEYTGSRRTGESFSQTVGGLRPDTLYYFYAQVRNKDSKDWESEIPEDPCEFTTYKTPGEQYWPVTTANAATDITRHSATLHGTLIKDGGEDCEYQFAMAGSDPYEYIGWVRAGDTFSYVLTGLKLATEYNFRCRAKNSVGEGTWSSWSRFTTARYGKPTVTTQPATCITNHRAVLHGLLDDDGGEACGFQFRYKKAGGDYILVPDEASTAPGGPSLPMEPKAPPKAGSKKTGDSFQYIIDELEPGQMYYFSARASNSHYEGDWGAELSFTTLLTFTVTEATVTTQPATDVNESAATLWVRIDDDGGETCMYQFQCDEVTPDKVFEGQKFYHQLTDYLCCGLIGESFSYRVTGLHGGRTYKFKARGWNPSAGDGPWGTILEFTTPVVAPTGVTVAVTDIVGTTKGTTLGFDVTFNGKIIDDGGAPCRVYFRYNVLGGGSEKKIECPGLYYEGQTFSVRLLDLHWGHWGVVAVADNSFETWDPNSSMLPTQHGGRTTFSPGVPFSYYIPVVAEIRGTHFQSVYGYLTQIESGSGVAIAVSGPWESTECVFLEGVPLDEEITAEIAWQGCTPGWIEWKLRDGTTHEFRVLYTDPAKGPQGEDKTEYVTRTFNTSTFRAGDRLYAEAYSADGTNSGLLTCAFTVIPQPHLPFGLILVRGNDIQSSPDELPDPNYWADTRGSKVTIFHDYLSDLGLKIDDDIPFFGGGDIGFTSSADIKVYVTRDYCRLYAYLPMSRIDVGKNEADDNIDGDFHVTLDLWYYFHKEGGWKTDSTVTLGADMKDHYDWLDLRWKKVGIWATTYMNLDLKVELGTKYWEGGKHEWDGLFYIYVKPWLDAGINIGVASLTFDIGGGFKWLMMFPAEDVGDAFKQCCVKIWAEVTVSVLCWDGTWDIEWKSCPIGKWNTDDSYDVASVSDADLDVNGVSFQLMGRDYVGPDYAVWQPPAPGDKRGSGNLSVQSAPTGAQAASGEEQVLQTNVFKLSQPALAPDEGELLLAWIYDDPKRSSVNRTQVAFSRSDKETWTPPVPIWDDGTADFAPQLATLPNGQVLCTWQNTNRVLPDDAELEDMAAALDIAVASYDSATGSWTARALTSDSHLDHTPLIAAAANNTAMLMWVSNEKDDILGVDPNATNIIRYCLWNGSTWSDPGVAATGIRSMMKTALAYSGTHAVYVYSADIDGDQGTDQDMELFALIYDGAQWSQPIRLTDDSVADANPQVVYDEGEPLLVWYRDKSIVSCRSLDITSIQQIVQPSSAGAMDFRLAKSPTGRISLVWAGTSTTVNALDVFTTTYDPVFGVWSDAYALTSDQDRERALAPAYVGTDELAIAYNKARVADDEEGDQRVYQTDLCVLRHTIGSDLAVTAADISMDKANPKPGDNVTITAVIHNLGDVAEANVPVAFHQGNPADGGVLIGAVQTIKGPIPAAGTGQASVSWTIPDANTAQSVYVVVDPQSDREERSLTNNVASIPVTTPDLTVKSFYSAETEPNVRRITAWIANEGTASAHEVGVSIRRDSAQGQELKSFTIPVINVGSSEKLSWDWDIAGTKFSTPEIVLFVVVDPAQKVPESNEKNNTSQCLVNVSKKADIPNKGTVGYNGLTSPHEGWLSHSGALAGQPNGDTNHDGRIDVKDLSVLAKDWLREAPWHTE